MGWQPTTEGHKRLMPSSKTALVIEDDPDLRTIISVLLSSHGLRVLEAADGERGVALARTETPDVVVLDVNLPGILGPEVCRQLRAFTAAPVLFLTGATGESDELEGFTAGGDDYVHKPFTPQLLAARVQALLKRGAVEEKPKSVVVTGEVYIDLVARVVRVGGVELELSRTEYDLISVLAENAGRIMTRRSLLDSVWGDWFGDDHVIDVSVSRLRRKLADAGVAPGLITTHRGLGYRFNA